MGGIYAIMLAQGLVPGMGIERRRWAAYHEPWLRSRIAVIAFPAHIIQHAIWLYLRFTGRHFGSSKPKQPPGGKMRLTSHETRFDFANSLHSARYRDKANQGSHVRTHDLLRRATETVYEQIFSDAPKGEFPSEPEKSG